MFSDPQFWVAVSFFLFIAAIFNPVRKMLSSNLDTQINDIKLKIAEAENLKLEAQKTLNEVKKREAEVEKEIQKLKINSDEKIEDLKKLSSNKLSEQINKRKFLAENKIDQIVRDMNLSVRHYILNTSINASTRILQKNLTKENKSELIKESINDLNNILKN